MFLEEIIKNKKHEVAALKHHALFPFFHGGQKTRSEPRGFFEAISGAGINLIAEVKKASPSAGVIRPDFDPAAIATEYERAGAKAISVLTDQKFFKGSVEHLKITREAVKLPILRKDFIIDKAQIHESKAAGADAVLLIVSVLTDHELSDFLGLAGELELDCLVEVHSPEDAERALKAGAKIIGINNRDLTTFKVDLNTTRDLIESYPKLKKAVLVSESGIRTRDDIKTLEGVGVNAVLIGETLLSSRDIGGKVRELFG